LQYLKFFQGYVSLCKLSMDPSYQTLWEYCDGEWDCGCCECIKQRMWPVPSGVKYSTYSEVLHMYQYGDDYDVECAQQIMANQTFVPDDFGFE